MKINCGGAIFRTSFSSFQLSLTFVLLIMVVFSSCQNNRNQVELVVTNDSFLVKEGLNERSIKFFTIDGDDVIAYLTKKDSLLEIIDFNSKKLVGRYSVPRFSTPSRVCSYSIISKNKVLYLSFEEVIIADTNGNVTYRWFYDKKENYADTTRVVLNSINGFPELIFKNSHTFFVPQYNYWNNWKDLRFYKTPVEAVVDLNSRNISTLNLTHPKIHSRYYLGELYHYHRCLGSSDKLVYSFMAHPTLYIESFSGDASAKFAKSRFDIKPLEGMSYNETIDMNLSIEHLISNTEYLNVFYDDEKNMYFRLVWLPANDSIENPTISDKPISLMIMNNELEIIQELKLEGELGWYYSFLTTKGLYIRQFNERSTHITYEVCSVK